MVEQGKANAYVRRIGPKVCITFDTGAYVWIEKGEEELLGNTILQALRDKREYEGVLPMSLEKAIAVTGTR